MPGPDASNTPVAMSTDPNGNGVIADGDTSQDPPTRVARLSYTDGSVSFQPGGQGDWGTATRNRPVTVGDKIWSDRDSRAELQAGQASIHLGSMTALSFLNLDEQTTQMRLAEGAINFRVRELRQGDVYEVDTPNLAFTVTQAGAFRIDVNENGDGTRVTVIRGEGTVAAGGQTYTLHANERGEFTGTDKITYFVAAAPAPDGLDRWSNERDLRDDNSVSAKYVSRDVPGYSDLDDNGTWSEVPDYGPVWYPTVVSAGWAPYSYGYWNYIGPWGWTWVDYSPWGFAPYHYGRWSYIGGRWGWCPGPYYARPIYGPAFVGFIGGRGWGVGFGFGGGWGFGGGIGWFPLGPHEPFRPWYRTSGAYYRNVNIHNTYIRNTTIINNRNTNFNYAYAHNTHAVTVASRNTFVGGQAINRSANRVTEASLRGAQVMNRADFAPTRQSYMGANATRGNVARPSQNIENRQVIARSTPAAAAAHIPVRTFGGATSSAPTRGFTGGENRGGFNNANRGSSGAGNVGAGNSGFRNNANSGFRNDRPNIGRAENTNNAALSNRPGFSQGQGNASNAQPGMTARQRELSQDKPQSHMRGAPSDGGFNGNRANTGAANNTNAARTWSAQGNSTDRGRAPQGFGSNGNSRNNDTPRNTALRSDRPSWAGSANSGRSYDVPQRSNPANSSYSNQRGGFGNNGGSNRGYSQQRSYEPPQRNYSSPSYSQPRGNGGFGGNSAPRYSAPPSGGNRGYSAPAPRGGGGAPRSSGGGSGPRGGGGGGGSHGGGGGSSHGRH